MSQDIQDPICGKGNVPNVVLDFQGHSRLKI